MNDQSASPAAEHDRIECGECGGTVVTSWRTHTFRYGMDDDAVDLTVRLPVRRCDACDFDFLDHEAERIQDEAVRRHLGVPNHNAQASGEDLR